MTETSREWWSMTGRKKTHPVIQTLPLRSKWRACDAFQSSGRTFDPSILTSGLFPGAEKVQHMGSMVYSLDKPYKSLDSFILFFDHMNELKIVQSYEKNRNDAMIYGYVIEIVNGWKFISLSKEE